MRISRILSLAIAFVIPAIIITGCSQKIMPKFLRNREYDYLQTQVTQPPHLKIPAGIDKPDLAPVDVLPAGKDTYPSVKNGLEVLKPPVNNNK